LGSPAEYGKFILEIVEGELIERKTLLLQLSNLQYEELLTIYKEVVIVSEAIVFNYGQLTATQPSALTR
jgi:excinuclease UvrABC helicase subunit UvrB